MAAAAVAAGEWLRAPAWPAALVALALLVALPLLRARERRGWWLVLPALLLALLLGHAQWRLNRLERAWPAEREARIQHAYRRLQSELRDAGVLADSLARRALVLAALPREAGFGALDAAIPAGGPEAGVAVYDASGAPAIWGGRLRLAPRADGDSVGVRLTPYYAVLELRRHGESGQTAVGAVLLAADPAVPDPGRSLAARFRERTEVGLRILAPAEAPDSSDVFDYDLPAGAGSRTLFSVQFQPPEQAAALWRARAVGSERVAWGLLLLLLTGLALAPTGLTRGVLGLLPLGLALRAPLGGLFGLAAWFDPAVFRTGFLGPLSAAAGPVALAGTALVILGALLWDRPLRFRGLALAVGGALLAGAPYLVARLGRGIQPPPGGVTTAVWLIWQVTLFLAAAGLLTLAVALLRRRAPRRDLRPAWAAAGAILIAFAAAVLGVQSWSPVGGWSDGYLLFWVPALLLLLPASGDRRAALVALSVVAGSGASVLGWGAELAGRMRAAREDMRGLTESADQRVETALRALGDSLRGAPPPADAPELYRRWRRSALGLGGWPATLGVWDPAGGLELQLQLAELDLPVALVGRLAAELPPADSVVVLPLEREPAVHHLLLARLDSGRVLSVGLGPHTALLPPSRLGRLLGEDAEGGGLYQLALAPSPSAYPASAGVVRWRRENRMARGERTLVIAGIARDVHATVPLGSTGALLVRGALILVLDLALLAFLWLIAARLGGRPLARPGWMPRLGSYEARLGAALAVFFLAPTAGFAAWGLGRLRAEVRDGRDRMIEQSLRDVVPPRSMLPATLPALERELVALSGRVDAEFALYRDGLLLGESAGGLLQSLGMLAPLLAPDAFHDIALDGEPVASAEGPTGAVATRVGYRAVRLTDLGAGVLAMPQTALDPVLNRRQRDLVMLFLLATLGGILASLLAARAAARALSRPVAELQAAALAFGKGESIPAGREPPPEEFSPVFSAFEKMRADVRKTHEAQERVARIVAWGEMASQVAHEIKNPLTPMRLGVQHLRRVHQDGRTPIGPVLESTTSRILSEIDRLDRIARSFSRFGIPTSELGPLETVKLPSVVRDVAELYRLGPEGAAIVVQEEAPRPAAARADEVKEALVNLLENSRNAGARSIRIGVRGTEVSVADDGCGIPAGLLPMIFEPRFSTSTSGSGLGLAIVKRLVEGWGGSVQVTSEEGHGTVVRLHLKPVEGGGPGPATSGSGTPGKAEE